VSEFSALHGLRIGCVQYLNSRPLIHPYDGEVTLEHPSALASDLAAGRLDAALVPTYEVLRDPHYVLVDGVAIASDGPVYSVLLGHRGPLKEVRSVKLDPASRTSQNLTRVLLAEYHGLHPEYGQEGDAELIIGNQAIEYRERCGSDCNLTILDLGAEWKRCTGLPFVYAMWAVRADVANLPAVAEAFRRLKLRGLSELEMVIARDKSFTPEFRRRYLTEYIRFDLGDREKQGIAKYRELLAKHRRIEDAATTLRFA
jgi:chorismate dehydratase